MAADANVVHAALIQRRRRPSPKQVTLPWSINAGEAKPHQREDHQGMGSPAAPETVRMELPTEDTSERAAPLFSSEQTEPETPQQPGEAGSGGSSRPHDEEPATTLAAAMDVDTTKPDTSAHAATSAEAQGQKEDE